MTPKIANRLATLAAEVEADRLAFAAGKLTAEEVIIRAEKRAVDNRNIRYYLRYLEVQLLTQHTQICTSSEQGEQNEQPRPHRTS